MKSLCFYANGPAGNHGCEALTRSFSKLFDSFIDKEFASLKLSEEYHYELNQIARFLPLKNYPDIHSLEYIKYFLCQKLNPRDERYYKLIYKTFLSKVSPSYLYLSIGGDNYSYGKSDWLDFLNSRINKRGGTTGLVGCSILETISDRKLVEDLSRYRFIIARESLTYQALKDAGVSSDIFLAPDPAFILDSKPGIVPESFIPTNTVGINISPMVLSYEKTKGSVIQNYVELIKWILENTDMNVALLPHVVWACNDDRSAIDQLRKHFIDEPRISVVVDQNAEMLKGVIKQCRFLVASRTHASIAAYSQAVPTLVVGYSVKARGIARDLFGQEDHYVVPVQELDTPTKLMNSFRYIYENEHDIRQRLATRMTDLVPRTNQIVEIVKQYL